MKRLALILLFVACAKPEAPAPAPPPAPPPIGDAAKGKVLTAQLGCNVCHAIPGIEGAQGTLGPSLAGIASRPKIANDTVANTPENLAKYVENPGALYPDATMPALGIATQDAKDIAAFLGTMK